MKNRFYLFIAVCFLVLFVFGCGSSQPPKVSVNTPRLSAAQAIEKAKSVVNTPDWQVAFVSNTGVTSPVTSGDFNNAEEGLMLPDGTAGQWVIEFFKDSPKTISEGGRTGKSYPLRRVLVTSQKVSELPKSDLAVPEKLVAIKPEYISMIEKARQFATSNSKEKFDVMSVSSNVKSNGEASWEFRFYDTKSGEAVNSITVSGDGKRKL